MLKMTIILAIETSQRIAGVALRDQPGEIHTELLSQKKRHDDDLMPAIDRMFKRARLTPAALRGGGLAISIGPGGFTGLRIAITTAKIMAEIFEATIAAVPSALVAAESVGEPYRELIVALACKNESCWMTRTRRTAEGEWRIADEPGIVEANTIDLNKVEALLGDEFLPPSIRDACKRANVPVIEPSFDPRACLKVGLAMLERGEITDPLMLSPLYPREPEAVTLWEKNQRAKQRD